MLLVYLLGTLPIYGSLSARVIRYLDNYHIRFGPAMPAEQRTLPPESRSRRDRAARLKRFAKQFERWCRGEPVRSYDTKWLAFVREHQLKRIHRPCKIDRAHGV